LELAGALRDAEAIFAAAASADDAVRAASGVARVLLTWFPTGHMLAWGKNFQFIREARPTHLLAALRSSGWGPLQRAFKAGGSVLWFRGEDYATTHPAALYLNLVSAHRVPGVAFDTIPITFLFEFGQYLTDDPGLDFLALRYVHSSSDVSYVAPAVIQRPLAPIVGSLEQDALREWFVEKFNALGGHLIRLENYMTTNGILRPLALQETGMTVARTLNETARLLATQERGNQRAAFWNLVDLYCAVRGCGIYDLFDSGLHSRKVVGALHSLPGSLGQLFADYAQELYGEWVSEVVAGVTDPARRSKRSVSIGVGAARRRLSHSEFFKYYMDVRRNTLHGYDLHRTEMAEFLAIHDGRIPLRIAEWARLQFLTMMADPSHFVREQRFLTK
jgi:hypothetical protein